MALDLEWVGPKEDEKMRANLNKKARTHRGLTRRLLAVATTVMAMVILLGTFLGAQVIAKEKPREINMLEQVRLEDQFAPMEFLNGEVKQDYTGQWTLNDVQLVLGKDSLITSAVNPGEKVTLAEGMWLSLMGTKAGNTFMVRTGTMRQVDLISGPVKGLTVNEDESGEGEDPGQDPSSMNH
jgi:hypothetical protein